MKTPDTITVDTHDPLHRVALSIARQMKKSRLVILPAPAAPLERLPPGLSGGGTLRRSSGAGGAVVLRATGGRRKSKRH